MRSLGTPRAVGDLLTEAIPQLTDRLAELRLHRSWPTVVGSDIARRTRPGSLVDGCLTVVVDNSPWLHELNLRQPELLARVRSRCPSVRVLRLAVGSLGADRAIAVSPEPGPAPALTEQDRREIEEATATIADPALAASAQRLLARAKLATGASGSPC